MNCSIEASGGADTELRSMRLAAVGRGGLCFRVAAAGRIDRALNFAASRSLWDERLSCEINHSLNAAGKAGYRDGSRMSTDWSGRSGVRIERLAGFLQ